MLNAQKFAGVFAAACVFALVSVTSAAAQAYDLAPVTTGITDQITAVLPIILPVAGGLIALFVGWRLIKRMTSA
jgi:cell division protein FtsX